MNNERRTILWLTVFAAAIRVGFFLISQNATGDAAARSIRAYEWAANPVVVIHGHWLPFPTYLAGVSLWIWDNLWWSPRIIPFIFGIASIWPLYGLVRLFFSKGVAIGSSLLFALFGLHVAQSVVSSAEALWMFFGLWAVFQFCHWWQRNETRHLVWAGLLWLPLAWSKPEAWWVSSFSVLLALTRRNWKAVIIYAVLVAIGPALWLLACQIAVGDAMKTFHGTRAAEAYFARSVLYKWAFWPALLLLALGPVTLVAALAGVWRSIRKRHALVLLGFAVAYLIPFFGLQLAGIGGPSARHVLFPATLLLPFAVWALEGFIKASERRLAGTVLAVGGSWLLLIFVLGETRYGEVSQKFASISPRARERTHVKEVTDWLQRQVKPDDCVVVDSFNDEESSLEYRIRLPPEKINIYWGGGTNKLNSVFMPLPKYVVYSKGDGKREGALSQVLALNSSLEEQEKNGWKFVRRHENSVYLVYEVLSASRPR